MHSNMKIKILKKGDSVLNVFNYGEHLAISVKRSKGHVDIVLITTNEDELPVISMTWAIAVGNGEIEMSSDHVNISTF
jgi:hypothetical protein